jgi:hypothetical protein
MIDKYGRIEAEFSADVGMSFAGSGNDEHVDAGAKWHSAGGSRRRP